MIRFVVPREQEFGVGDYLATWGSGLAGRVEILHYEALPGLPSLPPGTYIFLGLDQLTPGGTRLVCELQDQLRAAAWPVLNDPRKVLLRFELLSELHRQGLNLHGVARVGSDTGRLRFPLFLRENHRHTGSLSPLLHSPADVERALGRAALMGYRLEELLLVEYFDTADAEGKFRKYSAYVIGPAVIPRGMGLGVDWMLKADANRFSEAMLREEWAYAETNPFEAQLRRIFEVSRTDFGRIDFGVKDGRVETWEINLNPTIGPGRTAKWPEWVVAMRQPTRDLFSVRFQAALEALDTVTASAPVAVTYSAECRRDAEPMVRPRPRAGLLVRLAGAAGPLRPVLNRAARIAAPAVARLKKWLR
jgi:hypothetical protein